MFSIGAIFNSLEKHSNNKNEPLGGCYDLASF